MKRLGLLFSITFTLSCPGVRPFAATASAVAAEEGASGRRAATKSAPLEIVVFYSNDDHRWPVVKRLLEEIAARYRKRTVFREISIDNPAGYAQLAAAEKKYTVTNPGDLTAVMGGVVLTSKGNRRDIELYLEPVLRRMLEPEKIKARRRADVLAYARRVFGADAMLSAPVERPGFIIRRVWKENRARPGKGERSGAEKGTAGEKKRGRRLAGWVVEGYRTIACGYCRNVRFFLAAAEPRLNVLDLTPVEKLERFGKPLSKEEARRFVSQFKNWKPAGMSGGKNARRRVDGITGATKTTRIYELCVRRALELAAEQRASEPAATTATTGKERGGKKTETERVNARNGKSE